MFQFTVLAPGSAAAVADVHGRRFNRNFGAGWNSGVDGSQPGFLQEKPYPRFQDNAFIEHTIQDTNQVIRIGNKGAHLGNPYSSRMLTRGPMTHFFFVFFVVRGGTGESTLVAIFAYIAN